MTAVTRLHHPPQLVMYPILNLHRHTRDLHWYLRSLEEVVIRALDNTSGGCRHRVCLPDCFARLSELRAGLLSQQKN
jgi:hypothetical protein